MTGMRRPIVKALAAVGAATVVVGAGVTANHALADPETTPTTARGSQTAGSVYANRTIPDRDLLSGASAGQQYSYWSEGADKRMHLSTALLFEPKGAAPAGGWPVVVYAHGSDGWAQKCSPSRTRSADDAAAVSDLLRDGYSVVTPDYAAVGTPGSPQYADFGATARNILDSVRAAVDIEPSVSSRWAVVGEGQGGAAAVTLARKATAWESGDLDFRGATATSLPAGYADLVAGLSPSSPTVPAAVVADVVYTLASLEADDVTPALSAKGRELVAKAKTACSADMVKAVGRSALADLVRKPLAADAKSAAAIREALDLPSRGFNRPVLLSQKLVDDTVEVPKSLQYLTQAQLASNKVTAKTYLTGSEKDADRQQRSAVSAFVKKLF